MKIAIVGAGIIGVTTAWELASDGHEVHVFERRGTAAEEASFANAGVIAPGLESLWAAPGLRAKALGSLFGRDGAATLRWPFGMRELGWIKRWRRASKPEVYLANRSRLQRLAFYSRDRVREITGSRELDYERSDGCMVLLRTAREFQQVQKGMAEPRLVDTVFSPLDADAARKIEPALCLETPLAGALYFPDAEVANCRQFALLLKREAEALGARFHFHTPIAPLDPAAPRSISLTTGSPTHTFDAVVVCAGFDSVRLLGPLGMHMPIAPVYGHSISARIIEPLNAPRSAVMDARHKVVISRMGLRVRVAGGAEIGGKPRVPSRAALETLYRVLQDWYPGAVTLQSGVQQWKGACPMLPDGPPVIGRSGVPGVWLNVGHGSSGWALSCGSARVLADLIAGREAGIDMEGLGIERLLSR
ncbi:MAG: FAD-dependent oxidoreductase [Ramlibacter sp.]|nr:FAD-dependent oxidoreductase [Ramlibacter sp.]